MTSRIEILALLALMAWGGSSPPIRLQGEPLTISSLAGAMRASTDGTWRVVRRAGTSH